MTDGKPHPDGEPTPPTSTGWSQGPAETDDELAPPFVPGARRPGEPGETTAADTDEFPVDAFDIEGGEGTAPGPAVADRPADEREPDAMAPGRTDAAGMTTRAGPATVDAMADRLEEMADRLRQRGAVAAEQEMNSSDRFTALLAGLLAGYLAGRP